MRFWDMETAQHFLRRVGFRDSEAVTSVLRSSPGAYIKQPLIRCCVTDPRS